MTVRSSKRLALSLLIASSSVLALLIVGTATYWGVEGHAPVFPLQTELRLLLAALAIVSGVWFVLEFRLDSERKSTAEEAERTERRLNAITNQMVDLGLHFDATVELQRDAIANPVCPIGLRPAHGPHAVAIGRVYHGQLVGAGSEQAARQRNPRSRNRPRQGKAVDAEVSAALRRGMVLGAQQQIPGQGPRLRAVRDEGS